MLRWAQLATLNPGNIHKIYRSGKNHTTPDTIQVKLSPNVVRIDIAGPALPNLSFYDLPGVINNVGRHGEEYLMKLVQNLVKDHVHADNYISLFALPITDDTANSNTARIVKEAKVRRRILDKTEIPF